MSGLALLAGVLLVANSVSLAMLDRRYEIGVLKAIGYSRRPDAVTLGLEYGMDGVHGHGDRRARGADRLLGTRHTNSLAASLLLLDPADRAGVAWWASAYLAGGAGSAWRPTRASPVIVLNERNG